MKDKKRVIAIYTGNRAEYGLQNPIIKAVDRHPDLDYRLLVSGAHLQEDFGMTKTEIEKDGFEIFAEVKITMNQDSLYSTAQAIGSGILNLSTILDELKPDFLVVYADRFEGFSAVITGTQMNIPTAHIEGGDLTEGGALDDSVRHAMTKLSHLHFCTNAEAKGRIEKMGEESWRIHNVGFPAIDLLADENYATPNEIKDRLGINLEHPLVILTQHSVTTEFELAKAQVQPTLDAMAELAKEGVQVIITYPNNDAGGQKIINEILQLIELAIPNLQIHNSLGRYLYHGVLNLCGRKGIGACLGNSSSGIKETPYFGTPTVNIGSRQQGRLRSTNVIDVDYDKAEIIAATKRCLFDKEFRESCFNCENPYGTGDAGKKIAEVLASIPIDQTLFRKKITY